MRKIAHKCIAFHCFLHFHGRKSMNFTWCSRMKQGVLQPEETLVKYSLISVQLAVRRPHSLPQPPCRTKRLPVTVANLPTNPGLAKFQVEVKNLMWIRRF